MTYVRMYRLPCPNQVGEEGRLHLSHQIASMELCDLANFKEVQLSRVKPVIGHRVNPVPARPMKNVDCTLVVNDILKVLFENMNHGRR